MQICIKAVTSSFSKSAIANCQFFPTRQSAIAIIRHEVPPIPQKKCPHILDTSCREAEEVPQSLPCPREYNLLQINIIEQTSFVHACRIGETENANVNIDRGDVMSFGHSDIESGAFPSVGIVFCEGDGALPSKAHIWIVTKEITENWRGEMTLILASRAKDELLVRLDA